MAYKILRGDVDSIQSIRMTDSGYEAADVRIRWEHDWDYENACYETWDEAEDAFAYIMDEESNTSECMVEEIKFDDLPFSILGPINPLAIYKITYLDGHTDYKMWDIVEI